MLAPAQSRPRIGGLAHRAGRCRSRRRCAVVVLALATQVAIAGRARADEGLTGDWGGGRTWLADHGIEVEPRVTQFYQGLAAGEGDLGYEYGGKADLLVTADLSKLGFWDGLSMTLHGEYNFGNSVNGRGGVLIPVNSALNFPGIEGADAYDLSSLYFVQAFGDSNTVVFGKINMIDIVSGRRPFLGGAGIDAFWNLTFVAPPTGTVPAYLLGALLSVRTDQATYRLWVYDPASYVNKLSLADAFEDGVTIRGSVQCARDDRRSTWQPGIHRPLQHPGRHRPVEPGRNPRSNA